MTQDIHCEAAHGQGVWSWFRKCPCCKRGGFWWFATNVTAMFIGIKLGDYLFTHLHFVWK